MLVPTISATAPATLPLFSPRDGDAGAPGRSADLPWPFTRTTPGLGSSPHRAPRPPPPQRLLGTRTRTGGQPYVARRMFGLRAPRAMAPCIRENFWCSSHAVTVRWRASRGDSWSVRYIHRWTFGIFWFQWLIGCRRPRIIAVCGARRRTRRARQFGDSGPTGQGAPSSG